MGETVTPTRLLHVYVEFVCPGEGLLPGYPPVEAEMLKEVQEALASIDLHTWCWDFARGRRHTHKMICWTFNLKLSAASVRKALSGLEAFYVISVRRKSRNLPVLQRPRRVMPLPACRCKEFPCKHKPTISWSDHVAKWKREDAAIRQRRQQRDRSVAGRAKEGRIKK